MENPKPKRGRKNSTWEKIKGKPITINGKVEQASEALGKALAELAKDRLDREANGPQQKDKGETP